MPVKTVPSVIIGSGSNKSIVNNIYNNDFGNTIITGYLTVDFYLTVDGNLTVGGAFQLSGDITVKNPSNVTVFSVDSDTGDTLTKGDITVKDSSDVTKFSVDSATGNTTIEGDLTVNGTTTTIDSVTLVVEDPVITLAKNANSNPTASTDAGLFLQRGSTENPAIIIWNETLNQFEVATVTGASSTTTNFTGGGVTKTFATFKAGDMYGSTIDIGGLGSFGSLSSGSLAIGEHTYTSLGIFLGEYGNLNIHSIQDYSSIILNHDVTSGIPSANAVIEVKRGSSTSAKITWNEGSDIWDFNQSVNLSSGGFSVNTSSFNVSSAGITQIGTNGYLQIAKASSGGKNAIYLNSDASGTPPSNQSASIVVWRGSSPAASLTWSELNTRWQIDNLYIQSNLEVTGTSTFTGDLFLGDTTNIFVNKPSVSTTPVIKLNRDETGSPTSDVIAIEVERGTSSNALLKWDEYNNNWDINTNLYSQKIRIRTDETSGSSSRVYIYFTHALGIFSENVYFYIYKTSNSGLTREVVPINIISTTRLQSYTSNGYSEVRFNNNTPYSIHANADAFIDMEDGASYYININSTNASGLPPTVSFLFRYDSNAGNSGYTYTTVYNADFIATGGYNGLIQVNNATNLVTQAFSAGTSIYDNVDNLPALSLEYSKGIGSIVLNSGVTDTPTDASILVDRGGLSSPAKLLWDESQTSWVINQNIRLIADGVNSSSLYLQNSGSVWINDGILALESRSANTTRIYLNSELTAGDTPTTDAKITVNRGNQTNAEIKWDETNDYWDISPTIYATNIVASDIVANGNDNLIPVYIYVKYGAVSLGDEEFFYIFTTDDNGVTREIVRLHSLSNLTEYTTGGHYRYLASASVTYDNTTPIPTVNAIAYIDPNKTYYFYQQTTGVNYPSTDFAIYVSSSILGSVPDSYRNLIFFSGATAPANYVYLFKYDTTTWQSSDIVRRVENGVVIVNTLSASSTLNNRVENTTAVPLKIKKKLELHTNTTAILLNSDETGSPTKSVQIEVERGTSTNSYIKWDEASYYWEISQNLKVLDSSSNTTLLTDTSFIYTYKPLGLYNSLFYKVQRISNLTTDIDSDVSFVVIENGALGSAVFGPKLPNLESDSIGGRVINIAVKGANYVEIYPPALSQYIRHGGTTYSLGNPLVLSGYSSVQLVSHIVGTTVKDWYVTAISNSDMIDNITASGAITIFNGKTYHCNPAGAAINLTLSVAPNGTQLTFRSISTQITTITTVSTTTPPELPNNYIEGTHNTITLNSNSEGLTIYYYGTSWWVSSMYGNVGITTVP